MKSGTNCPYELVSLGARMDDGKRDEEIRVPLESAKSKWSPEPGELGGAAEPVKGSSAKMAEPPVSRISPSIAFLADITYTVGIHYGDAGAVAQLLMTHTPPRRCGETTEWVDAGMRALSVCLNLGPINEEPIDVGPRLSVHRGVAALDYGERDWCMCIPDPGRAWLQHAVDGGPVRLLVAFEPSRSNRTHGEWGRFVDEAVEARTIRWGTTHVRRSWRLNQRTSRRAGLQVRHHVEWPLR